MTEKKSTVPGSNTGLCAKQRRYPDLSDDHPEQWEPAPFRQTWPLWLAIGFGLLLWVIVIVVLIVKLG